MFKNNHLFALARSGKLNLPSRRLEKYRTTIDRIIYPVLVLLFAYIAPRLSVFIGMPLLVLLNSLPDMGLPLRLFSYLVSAFLPFFFLVWLWLLLFESRSLKTTGMERPWLKKYIRGLLIGLLIFCIITAIHLLFDQAKIESVPLLTRGLLPLTGALLLLGGWIVQGAAEEVLTRGLLLPVIGTRWGTLAGVLISSLWFSLLHLNNNNLSTIGLINLALFGLFASIYVLAEGSMWGIFAIHSIWNWAQGNLFGFPVSGNQQAGGVLIDLTETGPDWLTGGLFGPEGGLIVTAVLIIGSLLVLMINKRHQQTNTMSGMNEAV